MAKPNRAKMCNWLASRLREVRVSPSNPADIKRMVELTRITDRKLRRLTYIASEMGWHVDASLESAQELMDEYDEEFQGVYDVPA